MKLVELFEYYPSSAKPPSKEKNPKELTKAQMVVARKRAKRGGRKYPNKNDRRLAGR